MSREFLLLRVENSRDTVSTPNSSVSSILTPRFCTFRHTWQETRNSNWMPLHHHGVSHPVFPSRLTPRGNVPSRAILHRVRSQYQQWMLPTTHHRNRTSATPGENNNDIQHSLVSRCDHRCLDNIWNSNNSHWRYSMAPPDWAPMSHAGYPASCHLFYPRIAKMVD